MVFAFKIKKTLQESLSEKEASFGSLEGCEYGINGLQKWADIKVAAYSQSWVKSIGPVMIETELSFFWKNISICHWP